jgi:hypothetical protein
MQPEIKDRVNGFSSFVRALGVKARSSFASGLSPSGSTKIAFPLGRWTIQVEMMQYRPPNNKIKGLTRKGHRIAPPAFHTSPSIISDEYAEEQAQGAADDWSIEAVGGRSEGGTGRAGSGSIEAHDLRLEGEVRWGRGIEQQPVLPWLFTYIFSRRVSLTARS